MIRVRSLAALCAVGASAAVAVACSESPPPRAPVATTTVVGPQHEAEPIALDESVAVPLENGCQYTTSVRGLVTPLGREKETDEEIIDPDLTVSAAVACPGGITLRQSENVLRPGPISQDALEDAIETRASVASNVSGRQCLYVPDMDLRGNDIEVESVAFVCALENPSED